jgi:undecaprenyl-diphosphatase
MLDALLAADRSFGLWISSQLNHPPITSLLIGVTVIGIGGRVWLALGALAWFVKPRQRMAVWRLLLAIVLAALLVDGVTKPIVGRIRPFVDHPEYHDFGYRPESASFPSGHAATSAAGALAIARIWPAATIPIWTLALLVALSRVALGVHFPTDVLGGLLLGYLAARFVCARPPDPASLDVPAREPRVRSDPPIVGSPKPVV